MSLVSLGIGGQNLQIVDSYTVSLFFSHFFSHIMFCSKASHIAAIFKVTAWCQVVHCGRLVWASLLHDIYYINISYVATPGASVVGRGLYICIMLLQTRW